MSTSAESAQQWLAEQPRSESEIQQVLEKLYQRLEKFDDQPEIDLSGSEAAINVLEQALTEHEAPASGSHSSPMPTSHSDTSEPGKSNLDTSELGSSGASAALDLSNLGEQGANVDAAPKTSAEKRARFEMLKGQLKTL